MSETPTFEVDTPWYQGIQESALRLAVSRILPMRPLYQRPPARVEPTTGRLTIEIVSHCWRYSHLHAYQLSSLVNDPPQDVDVIMTVFHAAEDEATVKLLQYFAEKKIANVRWNWQQIPAPELFRRAIGRNQVALNTKADWVWFADCDLVFGPGCLDGLGAALQGRDDFLVFPQQERITPLLTDDSPMLKAAKEPKVVSVDIHDFKVRVMERAVGAYQIVHGDICRSMGYCKDVSAYQRPTDRWKKTFEDRAFRWLLGTHGVPVDVPSVYRIRHIEKGRYHGNKGVSHVRKQIRKAQNSARGH